MTETSRNAKKERTSGETNHNNGSKNFYSLEAKYPTTPLSSLILRKRCVIRLAMIFTVAFIITIFAIVSDRNVLSLPMMMMMSKESRNGISHTSEEDNLSDPIRFISVSGLYHTGSTAMWNYIRINENVSKLRGINLTAYGMTEGGGYPPCGVPLLQDSSVDMNQVMGNSSGTADQNLILYDEWGTVWGNLHPHGPSSSKNFLHMKPPHKQEVFFTWWKHTPPQHPLLGCFRPDTLYVIMIRHPKSWEKSMVNKSYDFGYDEGLKQWRLIRRNPRRLPTLEMRFKSLFHAWAYYVNGYLSWESFSAGINCYEDIVSETSSSSSSFSTGRKDNCLGGKNMIPRNRRNVLIVRYEDFIVDPKTTLAQIFSFASRGLLSAEKDREKFISYEEQELETAVEALENLKRENFFSVNYSDWKDANKLPRICAKAGYRCDESPELIFTKT